MRSRAQRRRVLAIAACVLWLFGIEVLPAIHLGHHDDHHTHDASGAIVDIDHGDHHHQQITAPNRVEPDHRDLEQLAIDHPVDSGHQAAGAAHHAVAVVQTALPAIPPVLQLEARLAPATMEIAIIAIGTQPSARGPPANA